MKAIFIMKRQLALLKNMKLVFTHTADDIIAQTFFQLTTYIDC